MPDAWAKRMEILLIKAQRRSNTIENEVVLENKVKDA